MIFLDGQEYESEAAVEAAFNPAIPPELKRVYITKPDTDSEMPLESPEKPADAFIGDPGTTLPPQDLSSPEPSNEVDWSKMNQPFGSLKSTSKEDTPVVATAANGMIKITEGDVGEAINVGLGAGPGTIGGVLSKTHDFKAAYRASEMARKGATPDEIWKAEGFYKGSDGRWRYEIPDQEMKLVDRDWQFGETGKLRDFVEHPKLFEAYPFLSEINFKVADKDFKWIGSYNDASKTLTINPRMVRAGDEGILDVISHELQHVIQAKEGFAQGSNPEVALSRAQESLRRKMLEVSEKAPEQLDELLSLYMDIGLRKESFAEYMYLRTPGEVEANTVAARRKLSDQQRKMFSPKELEKLLEGEVNTLHGGKYRKEFVYPKPF